MSWYNETYTVKNSPWRNGKGDMVKELVDACATGSRSCATIPCPSGPWIVAAGALLPNKTALDRRQKSA